MRLVFYPSCVEVGALGEGQVGPCDGEGVESTRVARQLRLLQQAPHVRRGESRQREAPLGEAHAVTNAPLLNWAFITDNPSYIWYSVPNLVVSR